VIVPICFVRVVVVAVEQRDRATPSFILRHRQQDSDFIEQDANAVLEAIEPEVQRLHLILWGGTERSWTPGWWYGTIVMVGEPAPSGLVVTCD